MPEEQPVIRTTGFISKTRLRVDVLREQSKGAGRNPEDKKPPTNLSTLPKGTKNDRISFPSHLALS
jgi:hypothetical protein